MVLYDFVWFYMNFNVGIHMTANVGIHMTTNVGIYMTTVKPQGLRSTARALGGVRLARATSRSGLFEYYA